ncbi:MAG: DsbA family protein [Solirubrobacterales bacterium]
MSDLPSLGSSPPPEPGGDDHVRGEGPTALVYLDLACPRCAGAWSEIAALPLRLCVRHFPVSSKRPRSPALHAAAEAAARHSEVAFWMLWDGLLADRAHVDDPHLWERARAAGLDIERFDRDRRSPEVAERVRRDFLTGIRAGATATPAGFVAGKAIEGDLAAALGRLA